MITEEELKSIEERCEQAQKGWCIVSLPLLDLIYRAATIHRQNKDYSEVQ